MALINAGHHDIILTNSIQTELSYYLERENLPRSPVFVFMDEHTHHHCFPVISQGLPVSTHKIVIGAGERNKNLHTCSSAWNNLLQSGADRNSLIINLGGGMVSDVGGFVAATFKRGVKFINIPTSLLGMVDASCGGKTGIDLDSFKNMVGVFAFPQTVMIDPVFLSTLPAKEWKNGLAEILKHALIADVGLWNNLLPLVEWNDELSVPEELKKNISQILRAAVKIKANIVARDPFEKNERKFLNFGHTIGHALETWSLKHDDQPLSHGEAIAIGIICESYLSMKLCGLKSVELTKIKNVFRGVFPVTGIKREAFSEVVQFMKADKKSSEGAVTYALLSSIGKAVLFSGITDDLLYESFHFYNEL